MQVHVVAITSGGFAQEDGETASALGAFTNPRLAQQVMLLWGPSASVHTVEVDVVPRGVRRMAEEMGVALDEPAAPAQG